MTSSIAVAALMLQLCAMSLARADGTAIDCDVLLSDFTNRRLPVQRPTAGDASKMLFFVHIPRTAGRTFHSCFLRLAHPPSKRCAKSYDVLRLNVSMGHCGLLSSHDDWSVEQYLPAEAAMVTQMRDPVSRVLSAYEFSVEVASRVLTRSKDYKSDPAKVNTRNVWPWSILVPLIERDMLTRVAAERALNRTSVAGGDPNVLNPYDNPLIMPLREFVVHPEVDDLLSNGAAMQLLGLTQYSHWEEAAGIRSCARSSAAVRSRLLEAAQMRLSAMAHVGVTEELHLSIASLAATLDVPLNTTSWQAVASQAFSYEDQNEDALNKSITAARANLESAFDAVKAKRRELVPLAKRWREERKQLFAQQSGPAGTNATEPQQPSWFAKPRGELTDLQARLNNLTAASRIIRSHEALGPAKQILPDSAFLVEMPLQQVFQHCTRVANERNAKRKDSSLKGLVTSDGRQVEFSRQARETIPEAVEQLIRDRNGLDAVLHEQATELLHAKATAQQDAGLLASFPFPPLPNRQPQQNQQNERQQTQQHAQGSHQTTTGSIAPRTESPTRDTDEL